MSIRQPLDHLELGTPVRWTHRAAVARRLKAKPKMNVDLLAVTMFGGSDRRKEERPWILTKEAGGSDADRWDFGANKSVSPLDGMVTTDTKINKTVVCWPEEGQGIVIGLIRKGVGTSYEGYESGYEYPEFEPGGFTAKEWIWLYAVKGWINGTNYYYAPMWAVAKQ